MRNLVIYLIQRCGRLFGGQTASTRQGAVPPFAVSLPEGALQRQYTQTNLFPAQVPPSHPVLGPLLQGQHAGCGLAMPQPRDRTLPRTDLHFCS